MVMVRNLNLNVYVYNVYSVFFGFIHIETKVETLTDAPQVITNLRIFSLARSCIP